MSPALVGGFLTTGFPGSPELKKKKSTLPIYLFIFTYLNMKKFV